jgi:hypothetical protein
MEQYSINPLQEVLAFTQQERANVLSRVESYLEEYDLYPAYLYLEGMPSDAKRLQILNRFVWQPDKKRSKVLQLIDQETDPLRKEYWQTQLDLYPEREKSGDAQDIDDAIYELMAGELEAFELVPSIEHAPPLCFSRVSADKIQISFNDKHLGQFLFRHYVPASDTSETWNKYENSIQALGFHKLGQDHTCSIDLTFDPVQGCQSIKTVLARLIFEVYERHTWPLKWMIQKNVYRRGYNIQL